MRETELKILSVLKTKRLRFIRKKKLGFFSISYAVQNAFVYAG